MTRSPQRTDWPTRVEPDARTSVVTEAPPPRRNPLDDLWPWLLALLVLVVAGVAAFWWFGVHERRHAARPPAASTETVPTAPTATTSTATVAAPALVGLTRARAAARARKLGLVPQVHPVRSGAAPGRVVAQRPAPGTKLARGGILVLDVARGPATAAVPDVTGRSAADAVTALRRAGFAASVVGVPSSEPKGTVVAEAPPAGTKARSGTSVRVNISKGRSTPAVTTTTPAAPASTPTATRSSTTTAAPSTTRATTTTTATPSAATTNAATTPSSPQPAAGGPTIPNVVGNAQTDAIAAVEQADLRAQVTLVQSQQPAGTVTSAEPAAGKHVQRGSTVTLKVSLGPDPAPSTTVPDVTGQDEAAATQALEDAGFTVETVTRQGGGSASSGQVVEVLPAGDAPQGWTITLLVG